MSDLQMMIALNARWWEFLEKQDDSTIQAIASGATRLSLSVKGEVPVAEPSQAEKIATSLLELGSAEHRRAHLSSAGLSVKELREVAKQAGFPGYSKLSRARLLELLASGPAGSSASPKEPPQVAEASTNAHAEAIAARLRETETEDEGRLYLDSLRLSRESLLAVATALGLTRVTRLSLRELKRRVLKQAIGARRKYAGLREW